MAKMPVATNQGFKALVPNENCDSQFLYYKLLTLKRALTNKASGSTFGEVSKRDVLSLRIAIPEVTEQRAIAAALSDTDALIESLESLMVKKCDIKLAVMQQLLTGRTRLPGFEGEWEACSLSSVASHSSGYWGLTEPAGDASLPVAVIRAGDIDNESRLTGSAVRFWTDHEFARAKCLAGDVAMTSSGNGLGKVWLSDGREVAVSNFVKRIRAGSKAHGPFLFHLLRSDLARNALARHTATSAYPNLRPSFYSEEWFELPSAAEQEAIATVLSDMDAEIEALEARLAKTRDIKVGMMQELLTGRTRLPIPEGSDEVSDDQSQGLSGAAREEAGPEDRDADSSEVEGALG